MVLEPLAFAHQRDKKEIMERIQYFFFKGEGFLLKNDEEISQLAHARHAIVKVSVAG